MSAPRFWLIEHDHNQLFVKYRALNGRQFYWTRDELAAERFSSEQAALDVIVADFNGKGRAVLVACT